jgi:hypothetical protein
LFAIWFASADGRSYSIRLFRIFNWKSFNIDVTIKKNINSYICISLGFHDFDVAVMEGS